LAAGIPTVAVRFRFAVFDVSPWLQNSGSNNIVILKWIFRDARLYFHPVFEVEEALGISAVAYRNILALQRFNPSTI
jgi:hypothetical protein